MAGAAAPGAAPAPTGTIPAPLWPPLETLCVADATGGGVTAGVCDAPGPTAEIVGAGAIVGGGVDTRTDGPPLPLPPPAAPAPVPAELKLPGGANPTGRGADIPSKPAGRTFPVEPPKPFVRPPNPPAPPPRPPPLPEPPPKPLVGKLPEPNPAPAAEPTPGREAAFEPDESATRPAPALE